MRETKTKAHFVTQEPKIWESGTTKVHDPYILQQPLKYETSERSPTLSRRRPWKKGKSQHDTNLTISQIVRKRYFNLYTIETIKDRLKFDGFFANKRKAVATYSKSISIVHSILYIPCIWISSRATYSNQYTVHPSYFVQFKICSF